MKNLFKKKKKKETKEVLITKVNRTDYFVKYSFVFLLIILSLNINAQDTIKTKHIPIRDMLVNKHTGYIIKMFPKRRMKVKSGYIVNKGNGIYEVNGRDMLYSGFKDEKYYSFIK